MRADSLPILAEATFERSTPPYQWVTFLNKTLKRRGFTFGVTEEADTFRLTVYDTGPWQDAKTLGGGGDAP